MTTPQGDGERYQIGELVGKGGMADVHRAYDRVLRRAVALKLLRDDDPITAERFLREARVQAKVEHAHVCPIYEVGVRAGRPFIAMRLVAGETLKACAGAMSLEQKMRLAREIAEAVHAAHEAGLIHRDLKPSNILVERAEAGEHHPYVVDFGIAREASARGLTVTGQVLGTPAYMAPEQALGHEVDRRADVYALGATLHELLAGVPPFTGETVTDVLLQVVGSEPVPLRKRNARIPADLETIVMRCLQKDRRERYDSARVLADDLGRYLDGRPIAARRPGVGRALHRSLRRNRALAVTAALTIVSVAAVAVGLRVAAARARAQRLRALEMEGERALAITRGGDSEEETLRARALALFDGGPRAEAEIAWSLALAMAPRVERGYAAASRAFEAALTLEPAQPRLRARLADTLAGWAAWAERQRRTTDRQELAERLSIYDVDGTRRARLDAPAILAIDSDPGGAAVSLAAYVSDGRGKLREEPRGELGATPLRNVAVGAGSIVLVFRAPGRAVVRAPILVAHGEALRVAVDLPRAEEVPGGLAYVPAGRFVTGNAAEELRAAYQNAPLHAAETGAFFIGMSEVTVGEWIDFLAALPAEERRRRLPRAERIDRDAVALAEVSAGIWEYTFQPDRGHVYRARTGEKLVYARRSRRAEQDWTRFPVTGVSSDDARAYLAWLDRTGRPRGARFCTVDEWLRAARGADEREFPAGDRLDPDDANFDETYDRLDWGPDEVGAHPASRSPFGVHDLAGNAAEWMVDPDAGQLRVCSGAYYLDQTMNDLTSCDTVSDSLRAPFLGFRVCASATRKP